MVRGSKLSHALGRQNAAMALLALLNAGRPLGANELTAAIEGFSGSGIMVARHLEAYGLVKVKAKPGVAGRSAYDISLTASGQKVAEALATMEGVVR